VGSSTVAGFPVHVVLLVVLGAVAVRDVDVQLPDTEAFAIVAATILLSGGVLLLPMGRGLLTRALFPAVRSAARFAPMLGRAPGRLLGVMVGASVVTVGSIAAMVASLAAFGAAPPLVVAAVVYLGGAAIAAVAPTPGQIGATEAILVAGYAAVGVDVAPAFAAVGMFRLVTFWLPLVPGWLALRRLRHTDRL
jgi:undecaprenyl-diphosphatase